MKNRIQRAISIVMVTTLLAIAVSPLAVNAAEKSYVFTDINPPGSTWSQAYGINAGGDMVGTFKDSTGKFHGFILSAGTFTTLDYPGDNVSGTQAYAIGPEGDIVGAYSLKSPAPAGNFHGFLLTKEGEWSTVDYPIGTHLMAGGLFRILPDGTMLGCFHDGNPATAMYGYVVTKEGTTAFDYPPSQPFSMFYGATPNGKTLLGSFVDAGHGHGFLLENGEVTQIDVPGSSLTQAYDINPGGEIVGTYTAAGIMHGFLVKTRGLAVEDWNFTVIDTPSATTMTHIRGINAGGDLVGDYIGAGGISHAFFATRTRQ